MLVQVRSASYLKVSRWSRPDRQVAQSCQVGPGQTGRMPHAWNGNAAIHFVQGKDRYPTLPLVQARSANCPVHGMATLLSNLSKARTGILLSRWSKPDRQIVQCMEWLRCYPLCPSQVDQLSGARTDILLSRWSRPERQARTPQCMDQERFRSVRSTDQMDRFFSARDDRAAVLLVHVRFASSPINGSVP